MLYTYKAVDAAGQMVTGTLDATTEGAATGELARRQMVPVQLRLQAGNRWPALNRQWAWRRRLAPHDLLALTQELAALLKADLTIDRSLDLLAHTTHRPDIRRCCSDWGRRVREGATLAEALDTERDRLPSYFVTLVRAGELGGTLGENLARLAQFVERAAALRERLISSLIYPAILAAMMIATLTLVLTVVLPRFKTLFDDAQAPLPLATRAVLALGDFVGSYGVGVAALLALSLVLLLRRWKDPVSGVAIDRYLLRARWTLGLIASAQSARFLRTVGTLSQSGVPLPEASEIALGMLQNRALHAAGNRAAEGLKQGHSLSTMLERSGLFPGIAIQMARVGEETGRLPELLIQGADSLDRDTQSTLDRLLSILVPLTTILMGAAVAGLIASVLVGILSLNDLAF